jgi:molybdenum cofactor biosynthesis protein B
MGHKEHRKHAPRQVTIAVLTVSTSRTLTEDESGRWMAKRAAREGHTVVDHRVVPDDAPQIRKTVVDILQDSGPEVLIVTGGTGVTAADVTIEAIEGLFTKSLTAFGPLFAQLSFEQIDSAALLSRAAAGVVDRSVVFCIPGSLNACKLACKALIFPEVGHLVGHVRGG